MRIALINTLYSPEHVGGAEVTVRAIAEGFVQRGASVVVFTLGKGSRISRDRLNGVEIVRIPIPNIYWPFPQAKAHRVSKLLWHAIDTYNPVSKVLLLRLLRNFGPNIVQTHNLTGFSTSVWRPMKELGAPLVHTLHDYSLLCPRVTMMRSGAACDGRCSACRIARYPRRVASSSLDAVIGVSDFVLNLHVKAGFFPNALQKHVIHNTYDVPAGVHSDKSISEFEFPLRIGFLGSIAPHKGVQVLLDAVSRLPQEKVVVNIAGAGSPAYMNSLRTNYQNTNIRFLGKVDADNFFKCVDVLVVPSIWNEPFGRVIIEAFAHGLPVIGTRVGGITEIIDDKVSGRLIPANDVEALENILKEAIEDPLRILSLGTSARVRAQCFNKSAAMMKFMKIHEELLAGGSN